MNGVRKEAAPRGAALDSQNRPSAVRRPTGEPENQSGFQPSQSQPPNDGADTKSTKFIVSDQKPVVKPAVAKAGNPPPSENAIQRLRLERHIPAQDMVEVVQTLYPGYDRFLHSKVDNGARYGIRLRADAERLLLEHFAEKPQKPPKTVHRSKPCRITARLSEPVFERLQRAICESGQTMQSYIEQIILQHLGGHNK